MAFNEYWSDWKQAERDALDTGARTERDAAKAAVSGGAGASPAAALTNPETNRAAALYKWDECALVAAAAVGDVEWVNELLAAGADVNELSPHYEYMPLIAAAQLGHVEVVRTLLMTAACNLTKKHMDGYISALESALHGYINFEGNEDEFTPEIRAMIIRAHVETADRIDLDTLLHIEASGAVVPELIKSFRLGAGARQAKVYSKATAGRVNLNDPPASKMPAILTAAKAAADRIAARLAAPMPEKLSRKQRNAGSSVAFTASYNASLAGPKEKTFAFEEVRETETHAMRRQRLREQQALEASFSDKYGKMASRFY